MALVGATRGPWGDGSTISPWKRNSSSPLDGNTFATPSTLKSAFNTPGPASSLLKQMSEPINSAFATMREDSAWSSPSPSNVRPITSVTGGLNYGGQSAEYYNYKSKGFSDQLATFLGRYNMQSFAQQQAAQQAEWAAQQAQYGQQQGGGGNVGGGVGSPGGRWAAVDRWNNDIMTAINRVQREFGVSVPANVVKAVMMLESEGQMVGCNFAGYCGLMQTGSGSNVNNFNASYNNTVEGNLYYGVQELANWYRAVGTGNWVDAAAAYFSGYNYDNPNVSDGYGTTVGDYRRIITQNLSELNNAAGSTSGFTSGPRSGGAAGAFATMFPRGTPGYDFGVTSGNGLYGYGTEYGLNGVQHTGMDIPQPLGSPIYAPAGALVVCVGCWRNDHITGGIGRIELEMPDGAHILFDHTYSSVVHVGDRVQAGQLLGTSGGMESPHTHLEVRVPDRSTSSGWRLVDPAAYFAGYVGGGGYSSTGGYTGTNQHFVPLTGYQKALQILYGTHW